MRLIYSILWSLVLLFVVSCGGSSQGDFAEDLIEEEVRITRFGIDIEGYDIEDHKIEFGETMSNIIIANGGTAYDVDRMDRASREVFPLRKIKAGNSYSLFVQQDTMGHKQLDYLVYELDKVDYVVFQFLSDSVSVYKGTKPVSVQRHKESAEIVSSMWGAIMDNELPYALGAELEDIYQWSIDFFGIQSGDNFTVIYDERFVDDSVSIGVGQIWGVRFTHSGITHYAIPFLQDDKVSFWEEDGASLRKTMLKAPLKYTRISSKFSNARYHPIYKVYRPHHGVDYAAPSGTPVYSVADGVVVTKQYQSGGAGYYLKIQHPQKLMTGYLHLSRYAPGIAEGVRVTQGQLIGYVGSTGASTGPHLDFRVWRNGEAIDPLKIPQTPVEPIKAENRDAFNFVKERVMAELDGDIDCDMQICDLNNIDLPHNDTILLSYGQQ
ncbi:MAG: peptidoglycan DD-metalloendopeptidase family protein [Rikenellaceae bacterium]